MVVWVYEVIGNSAVNVFARSDALRVVLVGNCAGRNKRGGVAFVGFKADFEEILKFLKKKRYKKRFLVHYIFG